MVKRGRGVPLAGEVAGRSSERLYVCNAPSVRVGEGLEGSSPSLENPKIATDGCCAMPSLQAYFDFDP